MLSLFILCIALQSAAVEGRKILCDKVPTNGEVSISGEGVYTFSCVNSTYNSYTLKGISTALCIDGVFNVTRLPACARTVPRTTSVTAKYSNAHCDDSVIERRVAGLMEVLQNAQCWSAGTCTWREAKHECLDGKLEVLLLFNTLDDDAHNSIAAVTDAMKNRRRANRQKRFDPSDFEDAETDDIDTAGCPSGSIENEDKTCSECTPGTFAPENGKSCQQCPIGSYQPSPAATSCVGCDEGATTEDIGSEDKEDCIATCTLPEKVYNGVFIVDKEGKEGGTVPFGGTVTLSCHDGYKFNDSHVYDMACENADSTFHNECYKVTLLPEQHVYKLLAAQAIVTCRVEASHDVIGFHVVHNNTKFNVEAAGDRKFEGGVAEQLFKITSSKGAVGDIRCMADVMEDYFETSNDHITLAFLDVSIKPEFGSIANVGESVAISALVTYDSRLRVHFTWTKDGKSHKAISTSENPVSIDGSQFFKSEVSFESVNFDDEANYSVKVNVTDAAGNDGLEKELQSEVTVRGFRRQPSDEAGRTHIVYTDDENVKLTCSYQGLDQSEDLRWVDESYETFYEEWQTSEEEDDTTTSILQFEDWPENLVDGKLMCAVFNGDDLMTESEQITLQSHEYEIQMGSDINAILGEDARLTCTASSPKDLEHPPTMTWYKKNGTSEDQDVFLEDGDHFITNNKLNGTRLVSILTIATADQNDIGQYYCMAQYDKPAYIEIIGEDLITLSITGFECDISQQNVENAKIVDKSMDGGRLTITVECDPGYWFSKGSGNLLYCDNEGSPVYPECERVIIETNMVLYDDDSHLLEVSYTSKSWSGNGTLCDDGWDNREAEIVCRQNGFHYGKAVSLMTNREDFVLTGLDCPCDEKENLEHCSATRYEDSELPCMPEETAGVRCYNESLETIAIFQKARSTKKAYKLFLKIKVYKFGEPIGLTHLDSSSFALKSQSVELNIRKSSVRVKEDAAFVKLVARKPKGHDPPQPDCVTVEMEGPINGQKYEFEHCFS